jgi:hypothetical protein
MDGDLWDWSSGSLVGCTDGIGKIIELADVCQRMILSG